MPMRVLQQSWFFVLIVTALIPALQLRAGENTLTEPEKKAGWQLLFDGKSRDGWRNFRQESISDGWTVEDGALTRAKDGAGDIITVEKFDNFELSIEYKIAPAGNSGIMFLVTEQTDAPWQSGPEVQVQDNEQGHDPQKSGWLYQLYRPAPSPATGEVPDACRPAGQWNHIQLRVTQAGCEINVNGVRYGQFQIGSDDWNKRVAASKFAAFPQFAHATTGHICLQDHGDRVAYRNIKIRRLPADGTAPDPIDGTLPLTAVPAFPQIQWDGWESAEETGRLEPHRPIVLTHGNDQSNRVFVADQRGVVYVFANEPGATRATIFLDLRDRVSYKDSENEEGLLGMAMHPKFAANGQFIIYYTSLHDPHTSVISRFTVSQDDPQKADPASEEQLLTIDQPFWNHNGGTVAFGPDGMLYIGLGDGGSANDPFQNGQNLGTLLGSILRIDVDRQEEGRKYAIPEDNPFVRREGACPEIYAYGLRNVWRLAFDRQTKQLWCADVGQNLWEEINLVEKGGNYGWALREGAHPFGPNGSGPREDLIEPIWEYDHQVGKSITGGFVYRGKAVPELAGKYVYADYVTGKIWALNYDADAKTVLSNEAIPTPMMPVISFGEDEAGEIYFMTVTNDGRGIYKFVQSK